MEMLVAPHPLNVRPYGSSFGAPPAARSRRTSGLGLWARLSDEDVLALMGWVADARSLAALACASGTAYAFASSESLWRALALRDGGTVISSWRGGSWRGQHGLAPARTAVQGVYSDALYHTWRVRCFTLKSGGGGGSGSGSVERRNGRRGDAARLSLAEFRDTFESGAGRPVVLTGGCAHWRAASRWRPCDLAATAAGGAGAGDGDGGDGGGGGGDDDDASNNNNTTTTTGCTTGSTTSSTVFLGGGHPWTMGAYLAYAADNADDIPLYLFDNGLARPGHVLAGDYEVPDYFADDLFALLPPAARPVDRWLLVGGPRSGSAFHTDPNGVSAWSATVSGRKKWIFFPPDVIPPGVRPSADGADLVAPLSVAEWFEDYYEQAAAHPRALQCETGPGDVVFVPRMWWHMVINVNSGEGELVVSVSGNFCSPAGLETVLRTLKEMPQCVAGMTDDQADEAGGGAAEARRRSAGTRFRERIVATLREQRPAVLDAALAAEAGRKTAWQAATEDSGGGAFKFGF